jgi:hypothetical protein
MIMPVPNAQPSLSSGLKGSYSFVARLGPVQNLLFVGNVEEVKTIKEKPNESKDQTGIS